MKVQLSFVFMCLSFLGFGQSRELLETPQALNSPHIEICVFKTERVPQFQSWFEFRRFAYPQFGGKPICPPMQTRVMMTDGLPSNYSGGFVSVSKTKMSGRDESTVRRK
jgi:hypothetical protein